MTTTLKTTWKLHLGYGVFLSSSCTACNAQEERLCGRCFVVVWDHKMSIGLGGSRLEWMRGGAL